MKAALLQGSWRVFLLLLIVYIVLLLVLFVTQDGLIFPGRFTQGRPEAVVHPENGAELVRLTAADGASIAALFGHALRRNGAPLPDAGRRPTLLFFYGNAMCLNDATSMLDDFRRLGVNVLIPDYEGYGMSTGRAGERGLYSTADAAYDYLQSRGDLDPQKIVVSGWSLGSAAAIDLASRRRVAGLAVFSAFSSMADMVHLQYRYLWIPTALLLRHRFESEEKIRNVHRPILIGHGNLDGLVPFSMSDRLAAAAGGPVTRLTVPGVGHSDFFSAGGDEVLRPLGRFLDGLYPRPSAPETP